MQCQLNLWMATSRVSSAWVVLGGSDCSHCGDMNLWTLRFCVALVQGEELAQAMPHSSSADSLKPRKVPRAQRSCASHPPVPGSLPVSRPLMSSPPLTRRIWSPSELWKALRMMPFRWQRLQMTSAPTTRWITLTDYFSYFHGYWIAPQQQQKGTSIILMSSSYVSCPRQKISCQADQKPSEKTPWRPGPFSPPRCTMENKVVERAVHESNAQSGILPPVFCGRQ